MLGVVVVKKREHASKAARVGVAGVLLVMGVCCVAFLGAHDASRATELKDNEMPDPDAPRARAATATLYEPQFDPDSPHPVVIQHGKGLKLEYDMQNVLEHMAKGSNNIVHKLPAARLYNPSADPDAPSHHDSVLRSPLAKRMDARLLAEKRMDNELKLKAQAAELSPKYMPSTSDNSIMLNLKSSKRNRVAIVWVRFCFTTR